MASRSGQLSRKHFADTVLRALIDVSRHPGTWKSERRCELNARKEDAREDYEEALAMDMQSESENASESLLDAGPFVGVSEQRKKYLLDYFDLNDEHQERVHVDPVEVTEIILDEVSESLTELEWWQKSRDTICQVLMDGHREEPITVEAFSHTERVWHGLLTSQEPNAWTSCQKAAILAGSLLLLHWEQSGRFGRLMEKSSAEAWRFPDRLFGGLFGIKMRGVTGRLVKTLYFQHRNLVKAAIDYVWLVRDALLYWGTGKGQGYEGKNSDDPYVELMENRADRLLLQFFPWLDVAKPDLAKNIRTWDRFQKDLVMFADAYDVFWREKAVIVGPDMLPRRLSDSECTWDRVTEILLPCQTAAQLRKKLKQFKTLQEQFSSSEVAELTLLRATNGTGAVPGCEDGAASVVSMGEDDKSSEEEEGEEHAAMFNVAVHHGGMVAAAQGSNSKKRKSSHLLHES